MCSFFIQINFHILKPAKSRAIDEAVILNTRKCDSVLSVTGYLASLEAVISESRNARMLIIRGKPKTFEGKPDAVLFFS
jgi:hypothetical protein